MSTIPDGRIMQIDGVGTDRFLANWLWMLWHRSPQGSRRLSIGGAGGHEVAVTNRYETHEVRRRRASAFNGELLALEVDGGTRMIWKGVHSEIVTYVPATNIPFEPFINILKTMRISDTSNGLTVHPHVGTGTTVEVVLGANAVEGANGANSTGAAGLQVSPIERIASLPVGNGEITPGGRLWRLDEYSEDGRLASRAAVVVGSTAVTRILPNDLHDPVVLQMARQLRLSIDAS